jgi:hypothetical protein
MGNRKIEQFSILQRVVSETRFKLDGKRAYEAFRDAEEGDEVDAGFEIVMLKGIRSARKRTTSKDMTSTVKNMPKLGRLV